MRTIHWWLAMQILDSKAGCCQPGGYGQLILF